MNRSRNSLSDFIEKSPGFRPAMQMIDGAPKRLYTAQPCDDALHDAHDVHAVPV